MLNKIHNDLHTGDFDDYKQLYNDVKVIIGKISSYRKGGLFLIQRKLEYILVLWVLLVTENGPRSHVNKKLQSITLE